MSRIIVGSGDFKYEVISPFGESSEKVEIDQVSHVSVDSHDNIYFYQRTACPVVVLDYKGIIIDNWENNHLVDGHGIFITSNDEIFVSARGVHEVLKFNAGGELLLRIGERGNPGWQTPFNHPTDVAISRDGDIFVTDGYGNACVHRFTPDGEHVLTWGGPGKGPGEFHTPHGVWVDDLGRVYVVDRDNNRVQIFTLDGEYITEWGDFFHPMDIYFDSLNNIYVTDQTPRFSVLNTEGELLARGFAPDAGHGLWGDSYGNLYLAGLQIGVVKLSKL
jgi:peptidylglycine monooxygenase|tara:strand:+ start:278 stop:1105 length:828 start_codon:yes stop_codon:yes gene_type:complete